MGLSKIKDILRKYTLETPRDKIIKEAFCEIIKETFNHAISTKNISISRNVLYIKTHPTLKHEIHINKQDIINRLNKKLSPKKDFIKNVL